MTNTDKKIIDRITIAGQYNGPDGSGNGGYVAGAISRYIDHPTVQVTLRRPPPLDQEMTIARDSDQVAFVKEDDVIATAKPSELVLDDIPAPIDLSVATECATRYPGHERHPFPRCYVCGPLREKGDGLRIFSGQSLVSQFVASPFITYDSLFDENGYMLPENVWGALDCPGSYAIHAFDTPKVMVLGRITATELQPINHEMNLISMAWYIGKDGRKNYCGSCIYDDTGTLLALAKATWIEVDPEVFYNQKNG